jgi:glutathione S-transferase
MLEELGVPYETVALDMFEKREHKSSAYLKLNPNGKVPCLVDGEFVIWESVAINFYLAEKYRPELIGSSIEEKARAIQWSTWAMVELQTPLVELIIQTIFTPEPKRDPKGIEAAQKAVPPLLAILNEHLADKDYLTGARLNVADFNMATVINLAVTSLKFPLTDFPHIQAWFARMQERPAFRKLQELRGGR